MDWPEEEEYCPPDDAKDIIIRLLNHSPIDRLGSGGVIEVKEHIFFRRLGLGRSVEAEGRVRPPTAERGGYQLL